MTRKCKGCGGPVQEDQARATFEEFDTVLCLECAAALREKQEAQTAPTFEIYRQDPDGPIFQAPEKAALPPNAIFQGYIRPKKYGPTYQLFKYPPKVNPGDLDPRARAALEASGFIFEQEREK